MGLHWIPSTLVMAAVLTFGAGVAHAEGGKDGVETLVTVHRFLGDEPSSDPDRAQLRYGILGGRWQAMGGGGVVLVGGPLANLRAAVALEGFIELVNFTQEEPVPWESFRANIGFNTLFEAPDLARALLPAGGRLQLAIGWFHESDHAANLDGYLRDYLASVAAYPDFDNGNFSAYEYVKVRLAWQQALWGERVTTHTAVAARLFPPPINPGSLREMRGGFSAETRVSVRATDALHPFLASYFELVFNDFVAAREGFRGGLDAEPLRYRTVSAGLDVRSASGATMSPELVFSSSHGRGVDFPRFYGPELGFRIGFLL